MAWAVLATTFLVGIGLVSLVDSLSEGVSEVPPLSLDETLPRPIVLVAPGLEDVLASLEEPARAVFHPPWKPLPELGWSYTVVLADGIEMPRLPLGWRIARDEQGASWRIAVVETDRATAVSANRYDLVEHVNQAHVRFIGPNDQERLCSEWQFGRWLCGLEPWLWVGPVDLIIRSEPRHCLWAHPRAGWTLVISYPDVPVGTRLVGRYGLADLAVEAPDGGPVELEVVVGDTARSFVATNQRGYHAYQMGLDEDVDRTRVDLRISADQDGARHFCVSAAMEGIGARLRDEARPPEQHRSRQGDGSSSRFGSVSPGLGLPAIGLQTLGIGAGPGTGEAP